MRVFPIKILTQKEHRRSDTFLKPTDVRQNKKNSSMHVPPTNCCQQNKVCKQRLLLLSSQNRAQVVKYIDCLILQKTKRVSEVK